MHTTTDDTQYSNHDEIAALAWQIWQAEGGQEGRDQEHWLKAEQQLRAGRRQENGRPQSWFGNFRRWISAVTGRQSKQPAGESDPMVHCQAEPK